MCCTARRLGRDLAVSAPSTCASATRGRPPAASSSSGARAGRGAAAGVASLGVRPTVEDGGRVLLEVHCLEWPAALGPDGGYGRCVRVELLHKLHDERKYASLAALREAIAQDTEDARRWWSRRLPPAHEPG